VRTAAASSSVGLATPDDGGHSRRRLIASFGFAALTMERPCCSQGASTHTSWPLQKAHLGLVAGAVALYFASYVFFALSAGRNCSPRPSVPPARGVWPRGGASAASGAVLPFRLDYVVKIGTLRKMRGVNLGLEAIRALDHLARPRRLGRLPSRFRSRRLRPALRAFAFR
jgi:hypothetical protein